jgi:hypothetical protein
MRLRTALAAAAAVTALYASTASAAVVTPVSYDMANGNGQASGGSYNYWDLSYNGVGNTNVDGAALSGGTGDLTDGVIANLNWFAAENGAGTGPYVGWRGVNPTIDFFFAALTNFSSVTFYFDDAEGAGGVSAPASVSVNGNNHGIADPFGSAPFAYTVDLTGLITDHLTVDIFRNNEWVFLSEVTFQSTAATVPLPAGGALLMAGLAGFGALRRRQKKAA